MASNLQPVAPGHSWLRGCAGLSGGLQGRSVRQDVRLLTVGASSCGYDVRCAVQSYVD